MPVTIRIRLDPEAVRVAMKSPDGMLGRWMQGRGRVVQLASIRDCPKRTGYLSEQIRMRWNPTLTGQMVTVGAYAPYAIYVHEGTKPHVIRARNASTLAFMWNGQMSFFVSVNHPGTKPNKFLSKNLYLFGCA